MSQMAAVEFQEPAKASRASTSVALRRKCNRYCEKEKLLHRSVISPAQDTVPLILHDAPPSRELRFGREFSQIPVHSRAQADLQTKLIVNAPGDIYEEEADRVAEEVMRMPLMAKSALKPNPAVANRVRASAGLVQKEPDSSDKQGDCTGWERDCERASADGRQSSTGSILASRHLRSLRAQLSAIPLSSARVKANEMHVLSQIQEWCDSHCREN